MSEKVIKHYGIPGQKWHLRRWQYPDGRFNEEGKERYFGIKDKNERKLTFVRDVRMARNKKDSLGVVSSTVIPGIAGAVIGNSILPGIGAALGGEIGAYTGLFGSAIYYGIKNTKKELNTYGPLQNKGNELVKEIISEVGTRNLDDAESYYRNKTYGWDVRLGRS